METQRDIEKLHHELAGILKQFADLCKQLGLKFFLVEGSLLGAIRNGGIIPWDDDIDVAMPRSDYERLVTNFRSCTAKDWCFFCAEIDPKCDLLFGKFVCTAEVEEDLLEYCTFPNKLSIDVFPLDFAKDEGKLGQRIKGRWIRFIRKVISSKRMLCSRGVEESRGKRMARRVITAPFFAFSGNALAKHAIRMGKSGNPSTAKNYIMYGSVYSYNRENNPIAYWEPSAQVSFDGVMCSVPKDAGYILSRVYGDDYMVPLPVEKRQRHATGKSE